MNKKHKDSSVIEMISLYTEADEKAGTLVRYSDGTEKLISEKSSYGAKADRNIKDRLFRFVFGNEKHKEWTLALYNSIEHTDYTDVNDLQIVTMDNAIYMHMKNDVSVLVGSWNMSFYEHQSTLNPNMPYRFLGYWHSTMNQILEVQQKDIYRNEPIELPVPSFHVIYNGMDKAEKIEELRLSDLFHKDASGYNKDRNPSLELIVTQHNINGLKKEDSQYCVQLYEYEWFVETVRKYSKETGITSAVNQAIEEMPEDFTIRNFILENRSEVVDMSVFEYNEERHLAYIREKGREEGRREGIAEGRREEREHSIADDFEMLMKLGINKEKAIAAISEQKKIEPAEVREILSSQ